MPKQNQATQTQADKQSRPKAEPLAVATPTSDLTGLPELLAGPFAAADDSSILGDGRLHVAQRRAMAAQIGRVQGNHHLQMIMASRDHKDTAASYQPNNGNGRKPLTSEPSGVGIKRPSRSRRSISTGETAEAEPTVDLEELGFAGLLTMAVAEPPPGNGRSRTGIALTLQRQEEPPEEDKDKPTEAEKAAALAAAKAAEAAAAQSAGEAKSEIAKSRAAKAEEKQAGQAAKGKAAQFTGKAKPEALAGKAAAPPKAGVAPPSEREGPVTAAEGPAPEAAVGERERAPASPEEDPAFQSVVGSIEGISAKQKSHAPAKKKSAEAQAAAEPPSGEVESKAQANQVGEMAQARTPGFDAGAFKAQLRKRIEELAPKTAAEADDFKKDDKLGGLKDEARGKLDEEKEKSRAPMKEATDKAPDTSGIEPKPVTPMKPTSPGAPPPSVSAEKAVPKQKGRSEVEAPLQERTKDIDKRMAEANVTEEQLAKSNEPEFLSALEGKKEAQTQAREAPKEYRQFEQDRISQAEAEAVAVAQEKTQAMHADRASVLTQVEGRQGGAKTEDESARAKVAAAIRKIYEETKAKVEKILNDLDGKVERVFDEGAAAAKRAFEDYVEAKMEAYKERRYGGWFGWARWLKDKLLGMPSEVNAFYQQGRQLFLKKMDAVIDNVVTIIGTGLTKAKAEIALGKQKVQDHVNGLPDHLKKVGQQAARNIQDKFNDLEESVNDKRSELIDTLANKYQENLQAVDARIEEMKAANEGLVSKVINAVVGVIKTILKLVAMLTKVLAKIVHVVGLIIQDPIGFLGKLIEGIKLGFQNFLANIKKHLIVGLLAWLTGALGPMGITLPDDIFSLEGVFSLVTQVLGLTWDYIRGKAVKLLGEPVVKALETGYEVFQILMTQGPAGLWKLVKQEFTDLKEKVIEQIQEMVITEVIKAGVKWVMSLLNPVGVFIKAAMAIYEIVMFFIEKGGQILDLINSVIDGVAAIASGAIGGAAKLIEGALAKALPLIIDLLARLLGIKGVVKKVQKIIKKVRKRIDKAIDKIILKAKKVGRKLLRKLGVGKGKEEQIKYTDKDRRAGLAAFEKEEKPYVKAGTISQEAAVKVASIVKKKHPVFKSVKVVDGKDSWDYEYVFRTAVDTPSKKAQGQGLTQEDLLKKVPRKELRYPTDRLKRPKEPSGHIPRAGGEERRSLPATGRGYHVGDHRGHLIGDRFGGGVQNNIVPMSPQLNLSSFKAFENQVAKAFTEKKEAGVPFLVWMKVVPAYPKHDKTDDESYRPSKITPRADVITLESPGKIRKESISPGPLDNPPAAPAEKPLKINEASAAEIAQAVPGLGLATAERVEEALQEVEIARSSHLNKLLDYKGIGPGTIKKLKEKAERRKIKFYEMEEVEL